MDLKYDLRFARPHEYDKSPNLHSGERFRKSPFSVIENAVYVLTEG